MASVWGVGGWFPPLVAVILKLLKHCYHGSPFSHAKIASYLVIFKPVFRRNMACSWGLKTAHKKQKKLCGITFFTLFNHQKFAVSAPACLSLAVRSIHFRSYHCVILLNQVDGIFHEWEHKSKPPSTHQFSLLKPSQTSHWFLITPSCFVYQFKRGELPMAGDTWQILQRQFLHLLVAQALEGWQLVLGAERRFTSEVWVTVKCVSFTVERCFQHRGGYYPDAEICWMLYIILHHQGGDV